MKAVLAIAGILAISGGVNARGLDTPSAQAMAEGKLKYEHYCSACHGKDGQGGEGPTLKGSAIVTGPASKQIDMVLHGKHLKMPMWGISEIPDTVLAKIVTYQRNAWGNNDKKKYGKDAGGVVSAKMFKQHRKPLDAKPLKEDVQI